MNPIIIFAFFGGLFVICAGLMIIGATIDHDGLFQYAGDGFKGTLGATIASLASLIPKKKE